MLSILSVLMLADAQSTFNIHTLEPAEKRTVSHKRVRSALNLILPFKLDLLTNRLQIEKELNLKIQIFQTLIVLISFDFDFVKIFSTFLGLQFDFDSLLI